MISIGPLPMTLAVLLVALAIAVVVGRQAARSAPNQLPVKVMPTIFDMLLVGALAARLGFVLEWLPQYLADPWSIIRIGDGGFSAWAGVLAGIGFGAWRTRKAKPLRRPLLFGSVAGLATWIVLGSVLLLLQQSMLRLPATELTTLEGGTMRLSALSGTPMVVNLWATWCPPCRREMPVFAKAQVRRSDVAFAFVNQGESAAVIKSYLLGGDLSLQNVLLDPFSTVSREAGSRGLPTTLFFDADGRLVDTHMGELSEASLAQKLQRFGPAAVPSPRPAPSKEVP